MIKEETNLCVHPFGGVMAEPDHKEVELDAAKAKVEKVREENEKLKLLLSTILTDYNSLQMHVSNFIRQQHEASTELDSNGHDDSGVDISLRLGRSEIRISKNEQEVEKISLDNENKEGTEKKRYALGLGFGFQSFEDPKSTTDQTMKLDYITRDVKNGNAENKCLPSRKDVKTARNDDQLEVLEAHEQPSLKKTRVCVKAPCEDPSINDGCQWRKYGQKTAKANPLPRAYYRCSMSSNCPVRKQVQRCGEEDTSAYMTTYEGNHDHPLPMEATHMAAGTSAAASLLQSGSSSSASLSYYFPFHHFSVSTTNAHPTVTLDLTRPNYPNHLPNYPLSSSSLSFSSSDRPSMSNSRTLSFNSLRSQAPLNTYSHLSHQTRLSGQP